MFQWVRMDIDCDLKCIVVIRWNRNPSNVVGIRKKYDNTSIMSNKKLIKF